MTPLADYHFHLERGPYTRDWLERFLAAGRARGVTEFGVTEHGHRFVEGLAVLDNPWVRSHHLLRLEEYAGFVGRMAAEGLPLRLGLEMDYVSGKEEEIRDFLSRAPFDFVLGSVHWLDGWGFDFVGDEACMAEWERRDRRQVFARYFELLAGAASSGLFDVIGHADLVKIMGLYPSPPWSDLAEPAIGAIAAAGVAVEVNTAGLRRPVGEMYPGEWLLRRFRELGVPVTVGSDAHEPEDCGRDFDRAVDLLWSCGYREYTVFRRRRRESRPLPRPKESSG
ncbi:MAG: histidinol-phosphatase [Bacillota bacterium]|nr:histidinol-phosphatase [Bacillota bacterium]